MKLNRTCLHALLSLSALACVPAHAGTAEGCSSSGASADERVFNWRFYVNSYPDLIAANINTPQAACNHWLASGIQEGRRAHPGFYSALYLQLYPSVAAQYGATNYAGAIQDYIATGKQGYVVGPIAGTVSRALVTGNYDGKAIYVSASSRTAGAIDSLVFNNHEFINSHDHGRELQTALTWSQWAGGYNPTEAGACRDGISNTTTSQLIANTAIGGQLATQVIPAFWEIPGYCQGDTPAHNTTALASNYLFLKYVQIGYNALPNVIQFSSQFQISENVPINTDTGYSILVEAPTGYLGGEFSNIYAFQHASNTLTQMFSPISALVPCATAKDGGGRCVVAPAGGQVAGDAVIFMDSGDNNGRIHGMAICTARPSGTPGVWTSKSFDVYGVQPGSPYTGSASSSLSLFDQTTKWNANFALQWPVSGSPDNPAKYSFTTYIGLADGTDSVTVLNTLKNTINTLYSYGSCV